MSVRREKIQASPSALAGQNSSNHQGMMDDFYQGYYFKLARILMIRIGQWPYDRPSEKLISRILMCAIFISGAVVQVTKLLTTEYELDIYVEVLTAYFIILLCFIKYCTCWKNEDIIRDLLEQIKEDWYAITNEKEIEIIKKFTEIGRIFGLFYFFLLYFGIFCFAAIPFLPSLLDKILPLNESRPRQLPLEVEYFVDVENHFYLLLLHLVSVAFCIHTVAGATDWVFMIFLLHICAMFNIVGYRLEHLFDDFTSYRDRYEKTDGYNIIVTKIHHCVQFHKRTIKFMKHTSNCYILSCFIQLLLAVIILTGLLLRLFDRLTPLKNISDVFVPLFHAAGLIFIIFLNIYPGQVVMDSSAYNFYQAYCGHWYMAPVKSQKLLILLMRRYIEPSRLSMYNVITASLETFASIVQTSISYFTVLYTLK